MYNMCVYNRVLLGCGVVWCSMELAFLLHTYTESIHLYLHLYVHICRLLVPWDVQCSIELLVACM